MKKLLLGALALTALGQTAFGQTTAPMVSLYEEFSGENCAPCASANPGLWTKMQANTSKVILIKYQSPIPSAGPLYNQNTTEVNSRLSYYSVNSAPNGTLNGGARGHVNTLTQAQIDAAHNGGSPFTLTASHNFNAAGDSVTMTITATAVAAFAPSGANMKLHAALVEHLNFATPPGTNGEVEFHNVMRKMYPDANGTSISNTWTAGATQTFTIKGKVPAYVDKGNDLFAIVWIQNDNGKAVAQAARSASTPVPNNNVAVAMKDKPSNLNCAGITNSIAHRMLLKNVGPNAVTSATIYYQVDNGTWSTYNWTGNLPVGDTVSFAMPTISVTGLAAGAHTLRDSVGTVNGAADAGPSNNVVSTTFNFRSSTPNSLPVANSFDGATMPSDWLAVDPNNNGGNWLRISRASFSPAPASNVGYNGTQYAMFHYNFAYPVGERNLLLSPNVAITNTTSSVSFYTSYRQYQNESDALEVVWSNDCGATWTSIWNQSGTTLANLPASQNLHVPQSNADWRLNTVQLGNIPTNSIIGFRATSDNGNNLWLDNINIIATAAVNDIISNGHINLYPNPAQGHVNVEFVLNESSPVTISVVDQLGRTVILGAEEKMQPGVQKKDLSISSLAPGLYLVRIQTKAGEINQRLSVTK